jgi:ribosomal protein S12 methylthiotransferase
MSFTLISLGCAKNQVDSEIMISVLKNNRLSYVGSPNAADVILVNTCGFIQSAKEESLGVCLDLKKKYPDKPLIMTGCLARRYYQKLKDSMKEVDGFFIQEDITKISEFIGSFIKKRIKPPDEPVYRSHFLTYPRSVYIKIADGCNNACSYCAIPIIKGPLKSRRVEDILGEISFLLDRNMFEFNLVAQDLGSFGSDRGKKELALLLERIAGLNKRFWVRLLYIHPDHFPPGILDLIKQDERFLPYFDIPFQHASKKILKKMNRKNSYHKNLKLVKSIRDKLPHAVIRTTFLVGFPGEAKENFKQLLNFQGEAQFDWLGVFPYSREEGTKAYGFKGKVKKKKIKKRKKIIEKIQMEITGKRLSRFIGKEVEVLIEEEVKGKDIFLGRSYMQAPEVDGLMVVHGHNLKPGQLVLARVVKQNGFDLEAKQVKC